MKLHARRFSCHIRPMNFLARCAVLLACAVTMPSFAVQSGIVAQTATAPHDMVVTEQHLASDVGLRILEEGGNAIDAAVAIGYAEAVVYPCCGNLGGGGFMLIHPARGPDFFLDFRETAPLAATVRMYLDSSGNQIPGSSRTGWRAAGVPGTVMGLETARERFGRLSRAQLIAPAIALARDGFILTRHDADLINGVSGLGSLPLFRRPRARHEHHHRRRVGAHRTPRPAVHRKPIPVVRRSRSGSGDTDDRGRQSPLHGPMIAGCQYQAGWLTLSG